MKTPALPLLLAVVFWPLLTLQAQNNEPDRFFNVRKYRADITLTFKASKSESSEYSNSDASYRETYRITFVTDTGIISVADVFMTEEERAANAGDQPHEGDISDEFPLDSILENVDFPVMPGMEEILSEGFGEMTAGHISFNKYKLWQAGPMMNSEIESDIRVSGKTSGSASIPKMCEEGTCESTYRESYEGTDASTFGLTDARNPFGLNLEVNLDNNTYSFFLKHGLPGDFRIKGSWTETNSCEGDKSGTTDKEISSSFHNSQEKQPWIRNEPLPASGMVLAGSKDITDMIYVGSDWEDADYSGVLQWQIYPADMEVPEAFLYFEEEGKNWMPEEEIKDKDHFVTAWLEWEDNIKPEAIEWTLYDVSAEPGVCMNSWESNNMPDLRFPVNDEYLGYRIEKTDDGFRTIKESDIRSGKEKIFIKSTDWGAYGKLRARIKVNGTWFTARQEELGTEYLPVPWDKNGNFIADAWEKEVGIFDRNLSPDWDWDPYPDGQRRNGDGLTLYEEYRGFKTKGHELRDDRHEMIQDDHVRTDPMFKDVFVYDQDGLFREHYAPYNPANLNWHYIDKNQMKFTGNVEDDENRWINYRTSRQFNVQRQYAMWVHFWPVSTGYETSAGESPTKESCEGYDYPGPYPLKCIYMIKIQEQGILNALSGITDPALKNRLFGELLTTTVIHEVGHGLGIRHHYNNIGTDEPDEDFWDQGVPDCAMKYESDVEVAHNEKFSLLRTRYCRKGDTWQRVAKDQPKGIDPQKIKMETYPAHNCYWEINVKGGI